MWDYIPKWVKIILIAFTVLTGLSGTIIALDDIGLRPIVVLEVQELEKQIVGLDIRTLQMIAQQVQKDIWLLEDRIAQTGGNFSTRDRLRELKKDLKETESQLRSLRGY